MPRVFRRVTEEDATPFSEGFLAKRKARDQDIRGWFESEPPAVASGWIVEGLVACGDLAILAGRPKDGKTCLAAALAQAVATGTPFGGAAGALLRGGGVAGGMGAGDRSSRLGKLGG